MIIGIGVDLIEVPRIAAALSHPRTGKRFEAKVFTAGEIVYCRRRRSFVESFAARFAAKEAVMKALGRGYLGGGIGWLQIEVVRDRGRPTVVLSGRAQQQAEKLGIARFHLSLTHTAALAVAYVIAES
ncbi:MAG: holo-ACP synthase [Deltaproteobacteria bacterium]|nr:holo-ACP synthase [Deltaproteobacteria bacterium]MBI3390590.1 holo-ACP synthase [Deltaproteobacteria bacterium]